jgi:3-hydroxybutyryl-CoA dehydrogenase
VKPKVACIGAGRMGRGLAIVFAYAGHDVALIDVKQREADAFQRLAADASEEIATTLGTLARIGLFPASEVETIAARVRIVGDIEVAGEASFIFEGVPEIVAAKRDVLARISDIAPPQAIIASTTSTILVDTLAGAVTHPERFLNAHWLNPPYLVPLVELSPGASTAPEVTARLRQLLDAIGKVPVVCAARPGYIVPRIQALAMNEAARMVEEGVATAEDIDRAVKYGFGFRFAVLGLLEFIDWGGGDILFYASRYLTEALGSVRYAAPEIIERNMEQGRIGLKSGEGFFDYATMDVEAYRLDRLRAFVAMLKHFGLARPPAP